MDGERPSTSRGHPVRKTSSSEFRRSSTSHHPLSVTEEQGPSLPPSTGTSRPDTPPRHPFLHEPTRVIRPNDEDDDADDVFAFARPPTSNDPPQAAASPSALPRGLHRSDSADEGMFAFAAPPTPQAPYSPPPPPERLREEDGDDRSPFAFSQPPQSPPRQQHHFLSDLSRDNVPGSVISDPLSAPTAALSHVQSVPTTRVGEESQAPSSVSEQPIPGTSAFFAPRTVHYESDKLTQPDPQPSASSATATGNEHRGLDDIELAYLPKSVMHVSAPDPTAYPLPAPRLPFEEVNQNRSAFTSWRYETPGAGPSGLRRRQPYAAESEAGTSAKGSAKGSDDSGKQDQLEAPVLLSQSQFGGRGVSAGIRHGRPQTAATGVTDPTVAHGITTWGDGRGGELVGVESTSERSSVDEDSPYLEVRAAVSNLDDPEMPALTFRVFAIGIPLTALRSALNTFFIMRRPSPFVGPILVTFLTYPCGRFLAWALPIGQWRLPRWLGGGTIDLNPCAFNIKEHALIDAMSSIGGNYAASVLTTASIERTYGVRHNAMFDILLAVVSQGTGCSFAYILQKSAIWSASLLWPELLGSTTLMNTLHADSSDGAGISRLRFFGITVAATALYTPIPSRFFTALGMFDWPTWIAPRHVTVNQIFGAVTGMGLLPFMFDVSQVLGIITPSVVPWRTALNMLLGWLLFYCVVSPAIYYSNTWFTGYLPLSNSGVGDRHGAPYNMTRILATGPGTQRNAPSLNETAYHEYSPLYLPAAYHTTHLMAFGVMTALVSHFVVHHGAHFWRCLRGKDAEAPDIHAKLMRRYAPIPGRWWAALLGVCIVCGIVAVEVYGTGLPVWGLVLTLLLAFIYAIPATFMVAVTTFTPPTNAAYELLAGGLFPGRAIPVILAKVIGVQTVFATTNFSRGLKLGHYMKTPPRDMFLVQVIGLVICCLVSTGIKEGIFSATSRCSRLDPHSKVNCAWGGADASASLIWGLVGPRRLWSASGPYRHQLWALLAGALLPPLLRLSTRRWPTIAPLRAINLPLLLGVAYFWPVYSSMVMFTWAASVFALNYYARTRHTQWWIRYNYVFGAALPVGSIVALVVLFLIFDIKGYTLNWWGNTVWKKTADWMGTAVNLHAPPGGFGPDTWA